MKLGAPLLPVCQFMTAPGHYHVHLDPALTLGASDTKQSIMQRVLGRFEEFIRERPDQWFAFRPMFKGTMAPSVPSEAGR